MLYKKVHEDTQILETASVKKLAEIAGLDESYIYLLKKQKRVASYEVYMRIVKAVHELRTKSESKSSNKKTESEKS